MNSCHASTINASSVSNSKHTGLLGMSADGEKYTSQRTVISLSYQQRVHQAYVGRTYPPITTQVIVTQHVAFLFPPYSGVCLPEVQPLGGTSPMEEGKDPQRALELQKRRREQRRRTARSLSDPVGAKTQG